MEPAKTPRSWREGLRIELTTRAVDFVNRCLGLTYRLRLSRQPYAARRRAGETGRCIYALWHEALWHAIKALRWQDVCVMVSEHRDGEIIARVVGRQGYEIVRGSSTRGGARAMLELTRFARDSRGDIALLVDGPTGPIHEIKEGVLFAASRTGLPVVPMGLHVDRAWHARSWDRHIVGKPFARVAIVFGPELRVPPDATREELMTTWRARLAASMDLAGEQARRDPPSHSC